MIYWAIQRPSDGAFMPKLGKMQRSGYTFDEPKMDCVPRLFTRKQDAKVALGHWLKGKVKWTHDYKGDPEYGGVEPVTGRVEQNLAIVEMELRLV